MSDIYIEGESPKSFKFILFGSVAIAAIVIGMYFLHFGIFAEPSDNLRKVNEQAIVTSPPFIQEPEPEPESVQVSASPIVQESNPHVIEESTPLKPSRAEIIAEHKERYEQRQQSKVEEEPSESKLEKFTADFFPPTTTVQITGSYNNATNWYYGAAPEARFNAVDDWSGIKRIMVQYKTFDSRCRNYECILENHGVMKLNKQTGVNKGHIILHYFAVDNTGKQEESNKLSIWYDGVLPELYVYKIYSPSNDSIPVGSNCNPNSIYQCYLIDVKRYESLTFEVLASDRISGVHSVMYRIVQNFNEETSWNIAVEDIPMKIVLNFSNTGNYRVQMKAFDVAGNESQVKQFWVRVT